MAGKQFIIETMSEDYYAHINEYQGITALHEACGMGKLDRIKELIESGTDVNIKSRLGEQPIHLAVIASQNNLQTVKLLLQAGSDINGADKDGCSPLHYICKISFTMHKHHDMIKFLLSEGADVNQRDILNQTPLHKAASAVHGHAPDTVKLLLDTRAIPDVKDVYGRTPLHSACRFCNPKVVQYLLGGGADPDLQDNRGESPLFLLIDEYTGLPTDTEKRKKQKIIAGDLLKKGNSLNMTDINGSTPLFAAAERKNIAMVELLLSVGANVNAQDRFGATPLHISRTRIITETLLSKTDPACYRDMFGSNPLHWAVWFDAVDSAEVLLKSGLLDISAKDATGNSPYTLAVLMNRFQFRELLSPTPCDQVRLSTYGDLSHFLWLPDQPSLCMSLEGKVNISQLEQHGYSGKLLESIYKRPGVGGLPEWQEVQNIKTAVRQTVDILAADISRLDDRFSCSPCLRGSMGEGTKCNLPGEFDFLLCLDNLSGLFAPVEKRDTPGCVSLQVKASVTKAEIEPFEEFVDSSNNCLNLDELHKAFCFLVHKAVIKNSFMHSSLPVIIKSCTDHRPNILLTVIYRGPLFKELWVSVDLVLAIYTPSWWPEHASHGLSILREEIMDKGCHVVVKSKATDITVHYQASISFHEAELAIFNTVPSWMKDAYILLKTMRHECACPKLGKIGEDSLYRPYPMSNRVTSFMLKMAFFHKAEEYMSTGKQMSGLTDPQKTVHLAGEALVYLDKCVTKRHMPSIFLPPQNILSEMERFPLDVTCNQVEIVSDTCVSPDRVNACHSKWEESQHMVECLQKEGDKQTCNERDLATANDKNITVFSEGKLEMEGRTFKPAQKMDALIMPDIISVAAASDNSQEKDFKADRGIKEMKVEETGMERDNVDMIVCDNLEEQLNRSNHRMILGFLRLLQHMYFADNHAQ